MDRKEKDGATTGQLLSRGEFTYTRREVKNLILAYLSKRKSRVL